MRRTSCFALTIVALTTLSSAAQVTSTARIAIRVKDTTAQTLEANVIIVGKVADLEKELVNTSLNEFPNSPKFDFQVATIKISDNLLGAKGLTTIRVGWQHAAAVAPVNEVPPPVRPNLRPTIRPFRGAQIVALSEGQEGCFFLKKHHEADFYILVPNGRPIEKKAENFATELDQVKKIVKVFESPVAALKAKEAADRQLAANVLVRKYRMGVASVNGQPAKQEEISAEESKLILQIISEMEWNNTGLRVRSEEDLWIANLLSVGRPARPGRLYAAQVSTGPGL